MFFFFYSFTLTIANICSFNDHVNENAGFDFQLRSYFIYQLWIICRQLKQGSYKVGCRLFITWSRLESHFLLRRILVGWLVCLFLSYSVYLLKKKSCCVSLCCDSFISLCSPVLQAAASPPQNHRYFFGLLRLNTRRISLSMLTSPNLSPDLKVIKNKMSLHWISFEDATVDLG